MNSMLKYEIKAVIVLAMLAYGWHLFKKIEPVWFPVVIEFKIDSHRVPSNLELELAGKPKAFSSSGTFISGTMNKVRGCDFVDVVAYSGMRMVYVDYRISSPEKVTRLLGEQAFELWALAGVRYNDPYRLYAVNDCATGTVITLLHEELKGGWKKN